MKSNPQNGEDLWFVAQLRPNGLARARSHLARQNYPTFAPHFASSSIAAKSRKTVLKPLFPGYLFVCFDPGGIGWKAINSTRGITRLVTTDPRHPTPLAKELILGLMARCDESGLLLPPTELEIGDRIRIISGPFADTVTTIETLPDAQRIGILMDVMGRSVRTTLPREHIEKLN